MGPDERDSGLATDDIESPETIRFGSCVVRQWEIIVLVVFRTYVARLYREGLELVHHPQQTRLLCSIWVQLICSRLGSGRDEGDGGFVVDGVENPGKVFLQYEGC